jgi:hypothetical protein
MTLPLPLRPVSELSKANGIRRYLCSQGYRQSVRRRATLQWSYFTNFRRKQGLAWENPWHTSRPLGFRKLEPINHD